MSGLLSQLIALELKPEISRVFSSINWCYCFFLPWLLGSSKIQNKYFIFSSFQNWLLNMLSSPSSYSSVFYLMIAVFAGGGLCIPLFLFPSCLQYFMEIKIFFFFFNQKV